jgi:hypothetical protein
MSALTTPHDTRPSAQPPGGYRQPPPEDRPARTTAGAQQHLGVWTLGPLGDFSADLLLRGPLGLTLDRHHLTAHFSGGLTFTSARGLPPLTVRRLEAELYHGTLDLDADGAGPGLIRAAELAAAVLLREFGLEPAPGRSLMDPWLERHTLDRHGRRVLFHAHVPKKRSKKRFRPRARFSARIDPQAELQLRLDRRALSIAVTRPLALFFVGLHLGLTAARYCFAERRVELEPERGLAGLLGRLLLPIAAFFLTRWLRRRLPPVMATDGYDPWEDDARLAHLRQLITAVRPPASRADATAAASSAADRPVSSHSSTPAPLATAQDQRSLVDRLLDSMRATAPAPGTWQLVTIPIPDQPPVDPPVDPPQALGPPETHAEALAEALAAPATAPPSDPPTLTLALTENAALHILFDPHQLRIHAERGLFLQADAHPKLDQLRFIELRLPRGEGPVALEFQPPLGDTADAALALVLRELLLPELPAPLRALLHALLLPEPPERLRALLRAPHLEPGPWSIFQKALDDGRELSLYAAEAAQVELFQRDGESEARIAPALTLQLTDPAGAPQLVKLHGLTYRWRGADADAESAQRSGPLELHTDPPAGPLLEVLADRLLHRLAAPWLADARDLRLIPPAPPPSPPPPPLLGPILEQRELPQIGHLELALARSYCVLLTLDSAGAATLNIEGGLHLRLRDLGVLVLVHELTLTLTDPPALRVHSEPALGELESTLALALLKNHLQRLRGYLWPVDPDDGAPRVLLLSVDTGAAGRLRLSLPAGAQLLVALDRQRLELTCDEGLHIAVDGLPWLPDVRLHQLSYMLEDGAIGLRISGIVERYYHESECVSVVTEAILSHLVRVLLGPHVPERLAPLGLRRFPPLTPPAPHPEQITLANLPIPGYGEAILTLDRGAVIVVTASEEELHIACERGFWIALPALFFEISVSAARYHPRSGEVQVGGLGQLENAILEAVIRQQLSKASGGAPLGELLDRVPADDAGRRVLFERGPVRVTLPPAARFTLALSAEGIELTTDPPIDIDGPAVLDYHLRGLRYDFARGAFFLALADAGVLASFFTGAIAEAVETRLSKLLLPMLPPAMQQPGYSLADDPKAAENLAAVVANALGRRAPQPS